MEKIISKVYQQTISYICPLAGRFLLLNTPYNYKNPYNQLQSIKTISFTDTETLRNLCYLISIQI